MSDSSDLESLIYSPTAPFPSPIKPNLGFQTVLEQWRRWVVKTKVKLGKYPDWLARGKYQAVQRAFRHTLAKRQESMLSVPFSRGGYGRKHIRSCAGLSVVLGNSSRVGPSRA